MKKNLLLSLLMLLEYLFPVVGFSPTEDHDQLLAIAGNKLPSFLPHAIFPNMINHLSQPTIRIVRQKSPSKTESCITKGNLRIALHSLCCNWWLEAGLKTVNGMSQKAWIITGSHQGATLLESTAKAVHRYPDHLYMSQNITLGLLFWWHAPTTEWVQILNWDGHGAPNVLGTAPILHIYKVCSYLITSVHHIQSAKCCQK